MTPHANSDDLFLIYIEHQLIPDYIEAKQPNLVEDLDRLVKICRKKDQTRMKKNDQILSLVDQLESKDQHISELNKIIEGRKKTLKKQRGEMTQLAIQIRDLQREIIRIRKEGVRS